MPASPSRHLFVALLATATLAQAAELRPDQKAAVEKILAGLEPSQRAMARPQIEATIANLSPEMVTLMVSQMAAKQAEEAAPPPPPKAKRAVTPEDLAYNKKQYEPVIRKLRVTQQEFDQFVDAQLKAKCEQNRDRYAVYDIGERYEMMELQPTWDRAPTMKIEDEIKILEQSYIPQDGRYKFDFSDVRTTFNKQVVADAVAKGCAEWNREAAAFHQRASALQKAKNSDGAMKAENAANARASKINEELLAVLKAQSPNGNYALHLALQNAQPIE